MRQGDNKRGLKGGETQPEQKRQSHKEQKGVRGGEKWAVIAFLSSLPFRERSQPPPCSPPPPAPLLPSPAGEPDSREKRRSGFQLGQLVEKRTARTSAVPLLRLGLIERCVFPQWAEPWSSPQRAPEPRGREPAGRLGFFRLG